MMFKQQKDIPRGAQVGSLSFGDGTATRKSILSTLFAAIVGGIAVGLLLLLSAQYFYLYCFQPIAAAILIVAVVNFALDRNRLRHLGIAASLAVIAGITLYTTFWIGQYQLFRRDIRQEILTAQPTISNAEATTITDSFLQAETGNTGFVGFVQLLAIVVPMSEARQHAKRPYCIEENTWLRYEHVGYVSKDDAESFFEALNRQHYAEAASYLRSDYQTFTNRVEVGQCDAESLEAMLVVEQQRVHNRKKIIDRMVVPGEVARVFKSQLDQA